MTVEEKITLYEKEGKFDVDINDDPEAPVLLAKDADYYCKKFKNKVNRKIANFIADHYFLKLIKKDVIKIDKVYGQEYLEAALKDGAIVTCNHFSPFDNYIIFHVIRKYLPKKYLYKVIREGNYTNFPGLYGYFFKHCNTLPLSSDKRCMMMFLKAVDTLLKNGESILIYPEQALWPNYEKPRPFKIGAFKMAYKAKCKVLPIYISFTNSDEVDNNGNPLLIHTVHIMPPVDANEVNSDEELMQKTFKLYQNKYEEVYQKKLVYGEE